MSKLYLNKFAESFKVVFTKVTSSKQPSNGRGQKAEYSLPVGLVYCFNLMAGTGALAVPKAFQDAGYGLGLSIFAIMAFISYISATFVLESMSAANATFNTKQSSAKLADEEAEDGEAVISQQVIACVGQISRRQSTNGIRPTNTKGFEIEQKAELGQMAAMFLNKYIAWFLQLCITSYLLGSLAVYCAVVPKSLIRVLCTNLRDEVVLNASAAGSNRTHFAEHVPWSSDCWPDIPLTRLDIYRLCVALFGLTVGPWVFSNVSATKYFQVFTMSVRWFSFIVMIVLASWLMAKGEVASNYQAIRIDSFGPLLGASIYTFMCQYSLPSVVPPIRNKQSLFVGMGVTYFVAFCVLTALSLTAMFTFNNVEDVYPLNFDVGAIGIPFLEYFLALFPVFTLSTNFPLLGITLRNNLRKVFLSIPLSSKSSVIEILKSKDDRWKWLADKVVIPLAVIILPLVIVLITDDVEFLVAVTGSYAGVGVQYLLPAMLIYRIRNKNNRHPVPPSAYRSPFSHGLWPWFMFAWSAFIVAAVTATIIMGKIL